MNKRVKVVFDANRSKGDYGRKLAHIYINGKNYEKLILKEGLAVVYKRADDAKEYLKYENIEKIKQNAQKARDLDLVILNLKNNKYHKPYCKYAHNISKFELIEKKDLPRDAKQAGCCKDLKEPIISIKANYRINNPPKELKYSKKNEIDTSIKLLFNSPLVYNESPSEKSKTPVGKTIIEELNKLNHQDIYIATYGFAYQPEIVNSFKYAEIRGYSLFGVADVDIHNRSIYRDTHYVMQQIGKWQTDHKANLEQQKYRPKYNGSIMHNKFITFGKNKVLTGSTNFSSSGTGGLNANLSILITSPVITKAFIQEAKQMYEKKLFHEFKTPYYIKNVELDDKSIVSVYFCPNPLVINELVKNIDNAKKYVYVAMFFLTHNKIINALEIANNRGVDVKVITDASAAQEIFSKHHKIRAKNIPVKVENWTGKMHMKTIIIDDELFTVGSMNATKTAETKNDENIVIVKNPKLAKELKNIFNQLYISIDDKWLKETPLAESFQSGNSCNDGIDNDHNWKYDNQDNSCKVH